MPHVFDAQAYRPGIRFLLSRHLAAADLDRATDEVVAEVRAGLGEDQVPAEGLVGYVHEKVRAQVARCEERNGRGAVEPGDLAAARDIFAGLTEQERAVVELAYGAGRRDTEIADTLGVSAGEAAAVRRRVRGEFSRLRAGKETAC